MMLRIVFIKRCHFIKGSTHTFYCNYGAKGECVKKDMVDDLIYETIYEPIVLTDYKIKDLALSSFCMQYKIIPMQMNTFKKSEIGYDTIHTLNFTESDYLVAP